MADFTCCCGRRLTAEALHAHMADCKAVPPAVRELNRDLSSLLEAGDYDGYAKCLYQQISWWKRLQWFLEAFFRKNQ